jgi:ribosomal protein L44E
MREVYHISSVPGHRPITRNDAEYKENCYNATVGRNKTTEDEAIVIRCLSCGVQNKVKTAGLEKVPKCGKCGAVLIEMREFGKATE